MAITLAVIPSMAVDGVAATSFGSATSNIALPGTPGSDAYVLVTNLGPLHVSVKLGTTNAVTVTTTTGVVIAAGQALALTIGSNTYIAGIAHGSQGQGSTVNIATGN